MNCKSRLFHNTGTGGFSAVGPAVGFDPLVAGGGGLISFDYDRDGDLDLLLIGTSESPRLFRSDGGNARSWLMVDPIGGRGKSSSDWGDHPGDG